jgi:peptide/nickel transport system permease protein
MTRLLLRRLAALPLILLATAAILYALAFASPYSPAEAYVTAYGPEVRLELREQYARAWGLDRSPAEQFATWIGQVLRGDLGRSRLLSGQPVAEVLAARAGPSALLLGVTLVVVLTGGLLAGVLAGAFRDTWIDWIVRVSSYATVFAPSFWIAMLLIWLFAVHLHWLPAGGTGNLRAGPGAGGGVGGIEPAYLILPVLALALTQHGWFTLYVRNTLLEVLREDYVRYAQGQGMSRSRVLFRHALPNALIPFVTLIGTHIPELIGGAVLIESIFGWPGLGSLTRQAALAVDLPLLLAIILSGAVLVVLGNALSDLLQGLLDPRIREAGR